MYIFMLQMLQMVTETHQLPGFVDYSLFITTTSITFDDTNDYTSSVGMNLRGFMTETGIWDGRCRGTSHLTKTACM